MSTITATIINYYHICHRKLWLSANGIWMEANSETVAEGKFIGDTTYEQRPEKYTQIELDGIKIDYFDAKNGVVHEVKKSDKMEAAAIAQVKYYLWKLEQNGIAVSHGLLEYPRLRRTERVELTDADRVLIPQWEADISRIIENHVCPAVVKIPVCKSCSYYEYCYSDE